MFAFTRIRELSLHMLKRRDMVRSEFQQKEKLFCVLHKLETDKNSRINERKGKIESILRRLLTERWR